VPKAVVPLKKVTWPPFVAGTGVAVRVTLVPGVTGPAGVTASTTPDRRTEPMGAGCEVGLHVIVAVPKSREIDEMAMGTTVPKLPVIDEIVAETRETLAVTVPFAIDNPPEGTVTDPPGAKEICTFVTLVFVTETPGSLTASRLSDMARRLAVTELLFVVTGRAAEATTDAAVWKPIVCS
jgi:hypothetical protein